MIDAKKMEVTAMRVISGRFKGHPLKAVPGKNTRPTTDRVKEAIFNMVPNGIYREKKGLDLFAGTGSLGIEALSRGCAHVTFVDNQQQAISVIYHNIKALGLEEHSKVYKQDAVRMIRLLAKRKERFRIIFVDPPYDWPHLDTLLKEMGRLELLERDGVMVVETAKQHDLSLHYPGLGQIKHHVYGDTAVRIYMREE